MRVSVFGFRRVITAIVSASVVVACSPNSATSSLAEDVPLQSGQQTTLFDAGGFTGLAVDAGGVLYLGGARGISTLAPGADEPTPLKNGGYPVSTFAVAPDGALAFVNLDHVVETVRPGSTSPEPLPFGKLRRWSEIAVAKNGAVYLGDNDNETLLRLDPGAAEPTELPVEGLEGIGHMVIDADDNLYAYMDKRIVKIWKGANSVEPVDGASENVGGLAVDAAGNLYATDNKTGTVSRRSAGGGDWIQLPFSGIQSPTDIAVDSDGNVYVVAAEKFKGLRVVKLAVG